MPKPDSNDLASQQARAFTLGMQFGQAQYMCDQAAMRVALVNMINLQHNTTGATYDLVQHFVLGVEYARMMKWINAALTATSVQFFNSVVKYIPSLFGTSSTEACVDDRVGDMTSSED